MRTALWMLIALAWWNLAAMMGRTHDCNWLGWRRLHAWPILLGLAAACVLAVVGGCGGSSDPVRTVEPVDCAASGVCR